MTVHQCPHCELRFRTEGEVTDHLRTDHSIDPSELEPYRYGGERQQKPIYPDLKEGDGEQEPHRVLVVSAQTLRAERLQTHLTERATRARTRYLLVVPAVAEVTAQQAAQTESAFVTVGRPAEPTEPVGRNDVVAEHRLREALGRLQAAGLEVDGMIGDPDPMKAAERALREFRADEIVMSTLPEDQSRWLAVDLPTEMRRRFSLPVTVVSAA
jgi:GABA permease